MRNQSSNDYEAIYGLPIHLQAEVSDTTEVKAQEYSTDTTFAIAGMLALHKSIEALQLHCKQPHAFCGYHTVSNVITVLHVISADVLSFQKLTSAHRSIGS